MWVNLTKFRKLIKYNALIVKEVVQTCKIYRFPSNLNNLTRCVQIRKNKKSSPSSSPLLTGRKKFQLSVPSLLQGDEPFNIPGGNHSGFRSYSKSSSSPSILLKCSDAVVDPEDASVDSITFPPPEEVRRDDPIFHVVAVDVHQVEFHKEDQDHLNGIKDMMNGMSDEEDVCNIFNPDDGGSDLINSDLEGAASVVSSLGFQADSLQGLQTSSRSLAIEDLESCLKKNKSVKRDKVVGYFEGPDFASMKHTVSGRVWLWTRSEDLLIIKDDGRIIDPSGMKRNGCHKSYPHQVRSSIGKLYERIFWKKDKEKETSPGKWATSSLDRHLGKSNWVKHSLLASLSKSDVIHCPRI